MTTLSVAFFRWAFLFLLGLLAFSPIGASAGMSPEEVKKFEQVKAKAEMGDSNAKHGLGLCYIKGDGVEKDSTKGFRWIRDAAEQGNAEAQVSLGTCYQKGEGVAKDYLVGIKWYLTAAEGGSNMAVYNLGCVFAEGNGVAKDFIEAYAYFNLSGINDENGRKALSKLEQKMTTEQVAAGQKRTKELQKEIEAKIATKKAGK